MVYSITYFLQQIKQKGSYFYIDIRWTTSASFKKISPALLFAAVVMFKIRANKLTWSYFILAFKTKRILRTLTRVFGKLEYTI